MPARAVHAALPATALAVLLATAVPAQTARPELWVYASFNLLVPANVETLTSVMRRAAGAGYSHVLLADSKFGRLGTLDDRYFRNVARVQALARELHLELVPAIFPIGYSEALLWHDPDLAEALPVRDAKFVVRDGIARLQAEPPVALKGGDCTRLQDWDWKDDTVTADAGSARMADFAGNARLVQKVQVAPWRQYHLTVRIRTRDFQGDPRVNVLAAGKALNHANLGVQRTQDWTTHHVVFHSLEHREVNVYLGVWGGAKGSIWWDDASLEETCFVNLVRRAGAPLVVQQGGQVLVEGKDYEPLHDPRMGTVPWPGSFEVWHPPPPLRVRRPDGTELRVSAFDAVTVHDGQVMICPSEPKTLELLRDQMERMHRLFAAKAYFLSHDEIRVLNQDQACTDRHLDAGALLADHIAACTKIARSVAPKAELYVWSDMFDPHHNATKDYYLVRGDLAGSWLGLDREVVVAAWYFGKRQDSLPFFHQRGHRLLLAGYYDGPVATVQQWLAAAKEVGGAKAVMYTTWQGRYDDLERFAEAVRTWR